MRMGLQTIRHRLVAMAPGWWLTLAALIITTLLWGLGRAAISDADPLPAGPLPDWRPPSLLLSAWSITLMAVLLLSTARARSIEPLFGGLDRAVRLQGATEDVRPQHVTSLRVLPLPLAVQCGC